jgi:aspartyl-tRNA(Asn)/glutamyl-tRNA(Gln) amidotransferase subunit C
MPVTRQDVLHVAALAKLELDEAEIETLIAELSSIVEYVATLDELDTSGVVPTAHLAVERAPFRQDRALACLSPEQALAEAPRAAGGGFAVPAFVDD